MDGASFYSKQSTARGILSISDVESIAIQEGGVFDQLILQFLPDDRRSLIYEAATGPEILQVWLRKSRFEKLIGSDFSENEVAIASSITNSIVHRDSLEDLCDRVSDSTCAAIIALDFYEHLPRESFRRFLQIAHSKLAPGGVLVMRGPNADSPLVGLNLYNDITHVWAYTTVCLNSLLRLAGFNAVTYKDDTLGGFHHGGTWKRWVMRPAQWILGNLVYFATRQRIRYWGMSIYVYAQKGKLCCD